jgi:hypothetical protein
LAEPGGGPWANCAWVEVSRGRFVGGRIVKAPNSFIKVASKISHSKNILRNFCKISVLAFHEISIL